MKRITTIALIFYTFSSVAQDTIYYDEEWDKVNTLSEANYYKIVYYEALDSNKRTEKSYFISGQLRSKATYTFFNKYKYQKPDGVLVQYFENGQLYKQIDYKEGKLNGKLLMYYQDGTTKRIAEYENDHLIKGKCYTREGKDTCYFDYEKTPEFPGGNERLTRYIVNHIVYPEKSKREKIEGKVYVSFIVRKDGSISDVQVVKGKGVGPELDSVALSAVRGMPKWTPGIIEGEVADKKIYLPISFKLNAEGNEKKLEKEKLKRIRK